MAVIDADTHVIETEHSCYGHHDHAADLEGLRNLQTAGGISERVYHKIVDANPRAAYAL